MGSLRRKTLRPHAGNARPSVFRRFGKQLRLHREYEEDTHFQETHSATRRMDCYPPSPHYHFRHASSGTGAGGDEDDHVDGKNSPGLPYH
jgi:hypothetical protein